MREGAQKYSCAVVTMSAKGAAGLRDDTSGRCLQEILKEEGYSLQGYTIIPDQINTIVKTITDLADNKRIDLIVTIRFLMKRYNVF